MNVDSPEHPRWIMIDSAKCQNGKFIISSDSILPEPSWGAAVLYKDSLGKTQGLGFLNPYHKSSVYGNFVLENGETTIHGDLKERGLTIGGSPETSFDFQYGLMNGPFRFFAKLSDSIGSLKNAGDTASFMYRRYKHEYDSAKQHYKQTFTSIIKQHPNRYVALYNIYNNRYKFTASELEQMADMMNNNIMESPLGKELRHVIKVKKTLLPGNKFPDFNYEDTSGRKYNLAGVKGKKATLIIFWASWCGPCRREIPALKKIYAQYHSKGLAMVSISIDDNIHWWKKAVKQENMPWLNLSNLPDGDYRDITNNYNLSYIPVLYLLNDSAKIVISKVDDFNLLKEKMDDLLKGSAISHLPVLTKNPAMK